MRRRWEKHGSRNLRATVLAAVLLGALAVGCSKNAAPALTTSSSTTSPGAGSGTTLEQGTGGQLVFTPTTLTVTKGQTITVSNVSTASHTFTVTGQGIDITNASGQSQQVTIDLPPGTYPFICRFHVSQGMKGTLVVG